MNEEICTNENENENETSLSPDVREASECANEAEKASEAESAEGPAVPELFPPSGSENEKNELLCRISELERELAARDRSFAQKKELRELFPEADPEDLPDSVKAQYENGVPLAAAYALYLHIQSLEKRRAEEQSLENARLVHGTLEGNAKNDYFTAEEVRAMSHGQVRMNFQSILDSMQHL